MQVQGWEELCGGDALAEMLLAMSGDHEEQLREVLHLGLEQTVLDHPYLCPVLESLHGEARACVLSAVPLS